MIVEIVEFDRQGQEIPAAQGCAAAQFMQCILEYACRLLQGRQLEGRGFTADVIDLGKRLLELAAEGILLPRGFLEHGGDGLHRLLGLHHEVAEPRATHPHHAAQHLALRLDLVAQILHLAQRLHLEGDVRDADQPRFLIFLRAERIELEPIMRRFRRPCRIRQAHLDVLEDVGSRTLVPRPAEQSGHVRPDHGHRGGGDQRRQQLLEAQIGEIRPPEQFRERLRHRGHDPALGVQQKQSLVRILENRIGQPVVGADQLLFFALVALSGDEHGAVGCRSRCWSRLMGVTSSLTGRS